VSLDSFDLDSLQRKDRAELATIAQHLGGKPGSRAKKADIIAMILELAGVTDGEATSDAAPVETPSEPAPSEEAPAEAGEFAEPVESPVG